MNIKMIACLTLSLGLLWILGCGNSNTITLPSPSGDRDQLVGTDGVQAAPVMVTPPTTEGNAESEPSNQDEATQPTSGNLDDPGGKGIAEVEPQSQYFFPR